MEEYSKVIRRLGKRYKTGIIDFYAGGVVYDSIDGPPSALGMSALADMCVKCLIS